MPTRMDYLPFIDDDSNNERYRDEVENMIEKELRPESGLHPEAAKLKIQLRENPLDNISLKEYRDQVPRIDITRYAVNDNTNPETLCVIDSYLRHQELTLQLLPQTLVNQWAINNDYLNASEESLQQIITNQENQIQTLNQYRANMQTQTKPIFSDLEQRWKDSLINRLDSLD
ncbi:Snt309p TDEL_0C05520 [Torulaspora delbrueckii]|uniref:Pre-mRNA-splicing factor SPF27 n=1 Tax=Torulaspora delbrueckii TaxID=4950 RepID=G8ZSE9_TORDE|nr:hypothetical protein TDEL_0C05520 [Torulaspora delbrueckii]CCE91441.1 hypothetical protein TDEL_0C05520 [Torulaspora delbrueckii]